MVFNEKQILPGKTFIHANISEYFPDNKLSPAHVSRETELRSVQIPDATN